MQVHTTKATMRLACRDAHASLGLVPTMGALHAGHVSLIRRARQECASIAATIFVNPLQFAPGEDLARYPRTTEQDLALLEAEGVDLVFLPTPAEMYAPNSATFVEVEGVSSRLDGAHRPGHFRGVATVVAKLFHLTAPNRAYFGQKDAVQLAVLRQMVRDLDFDLELIACPIVRDADGLALSSRNLYLTPDQRQRALALPRALIAMQQAVLGHPQAAPEKILGLGRELLVSLDLEYLEAVHPDTLEAVTQFAPGTLVAVAAQVGTTRLIDNLLTT